MLISNDVSFVLFFSVVIESYAWSLIDETF